MKKVLLTGATGYIGRKFVEIYSDDLEIVALTRNVEKYESSDLFSKTKLISIDNFLDSNISMKDHVLLNLAFPRSSDSESLLDAFDFIYKIYRKFRDLNGKHIVNISSQSVYDIDRVKPAKETDLVKVFSMYGLAKVYSEQYTIDFCKKNNMDYINLRLASIIGPKFDQRFINKFVYSYLDDKGINIIDKGETFSYINVYDAIKLFYNIIVDSNIKWNECYNIGVEESYTITEIIEEIKKIDHDYKGNISIKRELTSRKTNQVCLDKLKKYIEVTADYPLSKTIEQIKNNK